MRKAMICASVMLAGFQVWPMVFGHNVGVTPSVARPRRARTGDDAGGRDGLACPATDPRLGSVPAPKSCYRQYRAKFGACAAGDQACHVKTADQWDLCEATGLWPQ